MIIYSILLIAMMLFKPGGLLGKREFSLYKLLAGRKKSHGNAPVKNEGVNDMALLETKDLGIAFGGLRAVGNFNMKINENELIGLIGPNGAGKTTVFNLLTGVYLPTEELFTLMEKI